jgi:hypothetical protein
LGGVSYVRILPEGKQRRANLIVAPEKDKDTFIKKSDIDTFESKKLSEIFDKSVDKDYLDHLAL